MALRMANRAAVCTSASAAASFRHLADLLTHHAAGFPNMVEPREPRFRVFEAPKPSRRHEIGSIQLPRRRRFVAADGWCFFGSARVDHG